MCAHVLDEDTPIVVADASLDPRFMDNPFVTGVIGSVQVLRLAQAHHPQRRHDRHAVRLRREMPRARRVAGRGPRDPRRPGRRRARAVVAQPPARRVQRTARRLRRAGQPRPEDPAGQPRAWPWVCCASSWPPPGDRPEGPASGGCSTERSDGFERMAAHDRRGAGLRLPRRGARPRAGRARRGAQRRARRPVGRSRVRRSTYAAAARRSRADRSQLRAVLLRT